MYWPDAEVILYWLSYRPEVSCIGSRPKRSVTGLRSGSRTGSRLKGSATGTISLD